MPNGSGHRSNAGLTPFFRGTSVWQVVQVVRFTGNILDDASAETFARAFIGEYETVHPDFVGARFLDHELQKLALLEPESAAFLEKCRTFLSQPRQPHGMEN